MARIPYNILLKYLDVGALINSLEIQVTDVRGRYIKCHCFMPEHNDSSPSMSINKVRGTYHCFGCRAKGTFLTMVTVIKGLEFPWNAEYIEQFSQTKNMSVRDVIDDMDKDLSVKTETKQTDIVVNGFQRFSIDGDVEEEINTKPVYYPMGTDYWSAEVYEWCEKSYIDYNLIKPYFNLGYCRLGNYRERVIIPIWFDGRLADFQARDPAGQFDQKDLYIYGIPVNNIVFNYDNINWDYPVAITEGSVDVMRMWPYNTNAIGVLGSYLSDAQATLLKPAKSIIILPDNDTGGHTLYASVMEKLPEKEKWFTWFDKTNTKDIMKNLRRVS